MKSTFFRDSEKFRKTKNVKKMKIDDANLYMNTSVFHKIGGLLSSFKESFFDQFLSLRVNLNFFF